MTIASSLSLALFYLAVLLPQSARTESLPLPYTNTFDQLEDKTWVEYRIAYEHSFHWFRGLNEVSHDYPVGGFPTQNDSVYDWFVSPPLQFLDPGLLSLRFNIYTLMGTTVPTDYFGIWFSSGDPDPAKGDYVEIVNLTGFPTTGNWIDTSGIAIPFKAEAGHIAFVYKCARNWFTVGVDQVTVTSVSTSTVKEESLLPKLLTISPNPFTTTARLKLAPEMRAGDLSLNIFNARGEEVWKGKFDGGEVIFMREEWASGVYYYRLSKEEGVVEVGTFIAQ